MSNQQHQRLVITGPVDVRPEVLEAQNRYMIGHRGKAFEDLFASIEDKLKQVFLTDNRVYMVGSSGTGFWEGASRNCIRDDKKVLHLISGAFSERWADISKANGKQIDILELEWGQAFQAEMVEEALQKETYDAVCVVHNETSTGVTNPLADIGEVLKQYEDTLFLVDTVSGVLGAELRTDHWGIDFAMTSSQKAFSLPPGLAFAAVSDKVLERAAQIEHRGYYFDLLKMEKSLKKNNTPSTPPVSLLYATEKQLEDVLAEGLENRWARHNQMRDMTHQWALSRDFGLFAQEGYRSPTLTCVDNTVGRQIDVFEMAKFMAKRGFTMDKGYGKIKGPTFRIGHMGDFQPNTLEEVFAELDDFIGVS
ncbi:MAG: alanine--glyoxylate aminotransferase family protein [Chloroflexota bacterium]